MKLQQLSATLTAMGAGLTLLAVCSASAIACDPPAFDIETLLEDGMWNNPSSIAVDENGAIHMAYMTQIDTDSSTKEIWYATDSGTGNWTFSRITDNNVREEYPHLQLDNEGNVHIAFHTGTATSNKIRYVNNVGNEDGTFNPIIDITDSGYIIVRHGVDANGRVHFTFRTQTANLTDKVCYTWWDADNGVGPITILDNVPSEQQTDPDLAVGPDGTVHIVYYAGVFSGPLVYFNNASGTFQRIDTGVAATNTLYPIVVVSPQNVVSIFYRIGDFLWVIDDGGTGTFGSPTQVFTGSFRPSFYNRFAVDQTGMRYVAFASNVGDNRGIYFIREGEAGFCTPVQLFDAPHSNQGASVAINNAGKVAVSYQHGGFDAKSNMVYSNIYVATTHIGSAPSCTGDVTGDNVVNVDDLLAVIANWGTCDDVNDCPPDIAPQGNPAGDGVVNVDDLLLVISAWGTCE